MRNQYFQDIAAFIQKVPREPDRAHKSQKKARPKAIRSEFQLSFSALLISFPVYQEENRSQDKRYTDRK